MNMLDQAEAMNCGRSSLRFASSVSFDRFREHAKAM
jgi:hypothetical protein